MANYPQELAQDAVCQSHTGHMTGLWFLPTRPLRLNSNEWTYTNKVWRFERAKFHPGPNIVYLKMATLASNGHDIEPARLKRSSQIVDYKNEHIRMPCSARRYKKRVNVRAVSTVTLSLLPVHIAITHTSPHLRSAVCWSTQFATSINNVASQRG